MIANKSRALWLMSALVLITVMNADSTDLWRLAGIVAVGGAIFVWLSANELLLLRQIAATDLRHLSAPATARLRLSAVLVASAGLSASLLAGGPFSLAAALGAGGGLLWSVYYSAPALLYLCRSHGSSGSTQRQELLMYPFERLYHELGQQLDEDQLAEVLQAICLALVAAFDTPKPKLATTVVVVELEFEGGTSDLSALSWQADLLGLLAEHEVGLAKSLLEQLSVQAGALANAAVGNGAMSLRLELAA